MKRLAAAVLTVTAVLLPTGTAFAAWKVGNLNGTGKTAATKLPAATDPASPNANSTATVQITFNPVAFLGKAIGSYSGGGYEVTRYAAASGGSPIGTATVCPTSPCDVTGVPDGTWYFAVTPALERWRGAAGTTRAKVVVDATPPAVVIAAFTAPQGNGNTKVTISGTATVGDGNVQLYFCTSKPCSATNRVADANGGSAAPGPNGSWTYTSGNLPSGTYWATAVQTDSVGNVGSATSTNSVTR